MADSNPDVLLTKSLTEIPIIEIKDDGKKRRYDHTIDSFSRFPTKESIALQVNDRLIYEAMELDYYNKEADYIAEVMRGFKGGARIESVVAKSSQPELVSEMVGRIKDVPTERIREVKQ